MALSARDPDLLAAIPDITPEIIAAGTQALREAYMGSFQSVWIATACFSVVGIIGMFKISRFCVSGSCLMNSFMLPGQPSQGSQQPYRQPR